ncbi:MAG: hypothetical protein ABR582_02435 [Gemmatimonadaceae bacterium]
MAMNTSKVVVGGIVAGIVLNVVDWFVYTKLLVNQMTASMEQYKPGSSAIMMSGNAITIYIITDFVFGLLLVYTYAAVRPRLGPGPRTAATVAGLFWLFATFINANQLIMGMMDKNLFWETALIQLITLVLGTWFGAMVYTEEGAPAA